MSSAAPPKLLTDEEIEGITADLVTVMCDRCVGDHEFRELEELIDRFREVMGKPRLFQKTRSSEHEDE